jgi:hypothetical protein
MQLFFGECKKTKDAMNDTSIASFIGTPGGTRFAFFFPDWKEKLW